MSARVEPSSNAGCYLLLTREELTRHLTHHQVDRLLRDAIRNERWQRRRLSVKPGLTCTLQVSGRSEVDFDRWMELDLHYIDHWSLWHDLSIVLRTIPAVVLGRGAR